MDGHTRGNDDTLIPKHGGYRRLKTFQLSTVIYDVTVKFCDKYLDRRSRTEDQMVQAARSGRQNIAEGSMDSGTSKKIELKLTGIAKGSLEELKLDYEDYLRQRGFPLWEPGHPALTRFKVKRCSSIEDFRQWVTRETLTEKEKHGHTRTNTDGTVGESPCPSVYVANGVLSLLNLCIYLLDRQTQAQAKAFEEEGGFTERLYRKRTEARKHKPE